MYKKGEKKKSRKFRLILRTREMKINHSELWHFDSVENNRIRRSFSIVFIFPLILFLPYDEREIIRVTRPRVKNHDSSVMSDVFGVCESSRKIIKCHLSS